MTFKNYVTAKGLYIDILILFPVVYAHLAFLSVVPQKVVLLLLRS